MLETNDPGRQGPGSRNVKLLLLTTVLSAIGISVGFMSLLDIWLAKTAASVHISGVNSFVGVVKGLSVVLALLLAVPFGLLIDRLNRVRLARLVSLGHCAFTALFIESIATSNTLGLLVSMSLLMISSQLFLTAATTIFADSTTLGMAMGPLITAFDFLYEGNVWLTSNLKTPIMAGALLSALSQLTSWLLVDTHSQEGRTFTTPPTTDTATLFEEDEEYLRVSGAKWAVPPLIVLATAIAAGSTGVMHSFGALYLIQEFGITPSTNSFIMAAIPLVCAGLSVPFTRAARRIGAPIPAVSSYVCLVACIALLASSRSFKVSLFAFLARGGFLMIASPLNCSLLNTTVRVAKRGRWNAMFDACVMLPSLSGMVGGRIADVYGYRAGMWMSAFVLVLAIFTYAPLLCILRPKRQSDFMESLTTVKLTEDDAEDTHLKTVGMVSKWESERDVVTPSTMASHSNLFITGAADDVAAGGSPYASSSRL